ncbi:hypothetical protein C0585_08510 [Candidatus Woesearchaeota archaeon]|nr:MAG: hypothetical protein C0585_08510 [Candidatus Woesearchaeota archaeon]
MHEHGITNEVVHQIIHACEDEGIEKPKKIIVELGELTSYKADPVLFYFESFKKTYPLLENSELEIKEIKGKVKCKDCGNENGVEHSPLIICPDCDSANLKVLEGDKIIINSID